MRIIVDKELAEELLNLDPRSEPQLLAGYRYDGKWRKWRISDAYPIEEGTHIQRLEERLESRHLYPKEPDCPGKESLLTYGNCNVTGRYGVFIDKQDSGLVALTFPDRVPLKLSIESF